MVLDDPRKRPYVVFWVSDDGDRCHAIQMAPTGQPDSVMVTFDDAATQRLTILRRALPRGTGTALFYRCNWCQRACRYLYLLTLSRTKLVSDLGLRCQVCARLRFGSQGCYRSAFSRLWGTRPRYPWDPRAVSHPWLLEEEFGRRRTPTANGVTRAEHEQGQAARETSPLGLQGHRDGRAL